MSPMTTNPAQPVPRASLWVSKTFLSESFHTAAAFLSIALKAGGRRLREGI